MPNFDSENVTQTDCHEKTCNNGYQCQQVVFAARGAGHALKELPSVQDPNAVEKHDETGQADWPDNLRFRSESTDGKTDEQHSANAKRKSSAKIDLADQVADSNCEKNRKYGLRADDVAREIQHFLFPPEVYFSALCSQRLETAR
jgi:hypothetical protein